MIRSRYLLARLIGGVGVLWGVSTIVFLVLRLSGDPVLLLAPPDASVEEIEVYRRELGFADPLPRQYLRFLGDVARGEFGRSLALKEPALPVALERLPATFALAFVALAVALVIAVPIGVFAALRAGSGFDTTTMLMTMVGQSMPHFWLGLMLVLLFAVELRWLPATVGGDARAIILPAVTLALPLTARISRLLRSGTLEVIQQDYIRTARAKGLSESRVIWRHALKNASLPVVTAVGLQLGYLIGGTIIVETVFGWPGIGLLAIQAIDRRDYPVVQVVVFMTATALVLLNVVVDLIYTWLDPRIEYR